ncbi:MAG: hypothetical protein ACPL4H_03665 [Anaerolineales bacterium]
MSRVLLSNNANLSRVITVDDSGNGDFTSIQAAIDAAHNQNPSQSQPYTILIAPGVYDESLTLSDYVHLVGLGNAPSVKINQTSREVIRNGATCSLNNLRISGLFSPMINLPTSFSGELVLNRVVIDEQLAEVNALVCGGGSLVLQQCTWRYGGSFVANGGSIQIQHSWLQHYHNMPLALTQAALEVHSGKVEAYFSRFENLANPASGGSAVQFLTTAPQSARFYSCVFRASSGYSIDSSITMTAVFAACRMNADINTSKILAGYLDYAYNANV